MSDHLSRVPVEIRPDPPAHEDVQIADVVNPSGDADVVSTPPISDAANPAPPDSAAAADEDDGYHTPTSPRHRIAPPAKCPPPPCKIPWSRTSAKRKRAADADTNRAVRQRAAILECVRLLLRQYFDAGRNSDSGDDVST